MKRRWLGIAICAAALLAAGCSSGTDVSRAADESDTGTAAARHLRQPLIRLRQSQKQAGRPQKHLR